MKTEPTVFTQLSDAIRACFPPTVRDQLEISPTTAYQDGDEVMMLVRVNVGEKVPHYNADALMAVLGAAKIEANRSGVVIRGSFAEQECEIHLVTELYVAPGRHSAARQHPSWQQQVSE